jgi:predicted N-acyltransferase
MSRMRETRSGVAVHGVSGIAEIPAAAWDACAGDENPFLSHAFLKALEDSGCVGGKTGWTPSHLVAEDGAGDVLGCAPLYAKSHSYGEYVFDWGWAEAWQNAGKRYYPKLQCAVPFTPVPGRRLLVRPDIPEPLLAPALGQVMTELAERAGLSSVHVTFATEEQAKALAEDGWLLRMGEQFHWHNRGYADFDAFLASLSSRKRKAIRKERENVAESGLVIETLTGAAITERHWDAFFRFYMNTAGRKWGHPYLNREFFSCLGATMADRCVLVYAERDGKPFAGALNLLGSDALFGRNWGTLGNMPFLHFELCYYRAIDFAIARGLARVEAGAQGEHKLSRGYMPVPTWSAHWIREAPFRSAVARFLEAERDMVARSIDELAESAPYKQVDAAAEEHREVE